MAERKAVKVLILGAAGRDFHNFNMVFRDNPDYEVVAFTAAQIPRIDGRVYPAGLAGDLYPKGIPILNEARMEEIIERDNVDEVLFAYSDVSHSQLMHLASRAGAAGADFRLLGSGATTIKSANPVISVCAARTGCGKSQTSRRIAAILRDSGVSVAVMRHPMPYGDLLKQRVQRFATYQDLRKHNCTIEEIEEFEQYIERGMTVYAGVDCAQVLQLAERDGQVIVWDGGNNDTPFVVSDLKITVVDPLRPGHELRYYPGEVNVRAADVIVVNKVGRARPEDLRTVLANLSAVNPLARVILAESSIRLENPELIRGKRVLVVEDGPTLTHGGMAYGAGFVAAELHGAAQIVDPRKFSTGSIKAAYDRYPHMDRILPALGYYPEQLSELEEAINRSDCDTVIIGTPVDLRRYVTLNKPAVRVTYELAEQEGQLTLEELVSEFLESQLVAVNG